MARLVTWVPDRQEVIWIDCDPLAGKAMRDIHPLLTLLPRAFTYRTSPVIGRPMSTAEYNADNSFAVPSRANCGWRLGPAPDSQAASDARFLSARRYGHERPDRPAAPTIM